MTDLPQQPAPGGLPVPRADLSVADLAVRRSTAALVRMLPGVVGLAPTLGHRARGRALGVIGRGTPDTDDELGAVEVVHGEDGSTGVRVRLVLDDSIPLLDTVRLVQREVAGLLAGPLSLPAPGDVTVTVVRTQRVVVAD